MSWIRTSPLILVLLLCTGCRPNDSDEYGFGGGRSEFDSLVDEVWLVDNFEQVDALEYLEGDQELIIGHPELDQEYIVPLCKTLNEMGATTYALVPMYEDRGFAIDILVDVSKVSDGKVRDAIETTDESFPGEMRTAWGHRWMTFYPELQDGAVGDSGIEEP